MGLNGVSVRVVTLSTRTEVKTGKTNWRKLKDPPEEIRNLRISPDSSMKNDKSQECDRGSRKPNRARDAYRRRQNDYKVEK